MAPPDRPQPVRGWLKRVANLAALVLVLPCAATAWLEGAWSREAEGIFGFWTHVFAILPGLPGLYLRRAFYGWTLEQCSPNCFIGFGAIFAHRQARVEERVYIGPYAMMGSVRLGSGCLIGSRASLLSGPRPHEFDQNGHWTSFELERAQQISIGENTWVGEGAIVMADIGSGSMVSAGAVVSVSVPEGVMVAGNPARFVRTLQPEPGAQAIVADPREPSREQTVPSRS